MVLGINNPLPSSMLSECKKSAKILTSFIDPRQAFGPDKIIPPDVLSNAKGLAILTVLKAGFLGSARFGSGIVVARLSDGSWSAPSAIATAGAGFGGQIGFELTDFVFILNDSSAVRAFSQSGALTLGGNVSLAAGPIGRNAEAAGAASAKGVAAVFSYSKTKGLFAGISLEGSMLVERKEANEKLYNSRVTAHQLLSGSIRPPAASEPLMRVLNSRAFNSGSRANSDSMYNDIPIYDDNHDSVVWEGRRGEAYGEGTRRERFDQRDNAGRDDYEYRDRPPRRTNTWADDVYDRPSGGGMNRSNTTRSYRQDAYDSVGRSRSNTGPYDDDYTYSDRKPGYQRDGGYQDRRPNRPHDDSYGPQDRKSSRPYDDGYGYQDRRPGRPEDDGYGYQDRRPGRPEDDGYGYQDRKPSRPTAPKPAFSQRTGQAPALRQDQAIALYTFDADQEGDLGFKKGEIITILKRTEKKEDWWTGRIGDRVGIFPSNYVDSS